MIRRILLAFAALTAILSTQLPGEAAIIHINSFRTFASGAAAAASIYGATSDTGTTLDARDATAYNSGTSYHYAALVTSGGSYYMSLVPDSDYTAGGAIAADPAGGVAQNVGNPVTDTSKWRLISEFLYVDGTASGPADDTTGVVSTNPTTAAASPFKTIDAVSRRITNGNGGTVLKPSALVVFRRGATYIGNFAPSQIRSSLGITSMVNDGTTTTVTTTLPHYLTTGATVTTSGATPSTCNSGSNAVITVTGISTFTFANTCGSAITGTLTYSEFHGNYIISAYGTGARPVFKFSDSSTISNGSAMINGNRPGLIVRDLDLYGEDTRTLKITGLTGSCAVGDTITGATSTNSATIYRVSTTGRLEIVSANGSFSAAETLNCTSGGSATYSSLSATGTGGIVIGKRNIHVTNTDVHGWCFNGVLLGTNAETDSATNTIVRNVSIYNNLNTNGSNGAGIDQGYGTNVTLTHLTIHDNGTPGSSTNHNAYLSFMTFMTFRYNHVYQTTNYGNHGLIIHGALSDVTISDNYFYNNSNALGINSGYPSTSPAESFTRFTVERNKIVSVGKLHTSCTVTITIASPAVFTCANHGLKPNEALTLTTTGALPTGLTAVSNTYSVVPSSITTNTFQVADTPNGKPINTSGSQSGTHTALAGQSGGYGMLLTGLVDSVVRNNLVTDTRYGGIELYVQTGDNGLNDTTATNTIFEHNTVHLSNLASLESPWCFRIQGALDPGIVFRNNIMSNLSTSATSYALSKDVATPTGNLTLNNNLYYAAGANSVNWNGSAVLVSGGIGAIRTAVAGTTGAEAAGAYGDPLYTSASTFDFTLQGGSPAKALASAGLATDLTGAARSGTTPSAGAYE